MNSSSLHPCANTNHLFSGVAPNPARTFAQAPDPAIAGEREQCSLKVLRIVAAVAGMLLSVAGVGALAEDGGPSAVEPPAAFVDAYVYACQPVEYDFAGVRETLDSAARRVHDGLFLGTYGGSCRDFYYGEVVPLLDGERQPYFLPVDL